MLLTRILGFQDVIVFRDLFFTLMGIFTCELNFFTLIFQQMLANPRARNHWLNLTTKVMKNGSNYSKDGIF